MSLKLLNGSDKFFLLVGTGGVPDLRPDCNSGRKVWLDNNVHFYNVLRLKHHENKKAILGWIKHFFPLYRLIVKAPSLVIAGCYLTEEVRNDEANIEKIIV